MALTDIEKQTIARLRSEGKSLEEIMGFIGGERVGRGSSVQKAEVEQFREQESSVLSRIVRDMPSDIMEGARGVGDSFTQGVDTANQAREQVESGEISPLAGTAKTIGGGLRAGAEAVGSGLLSLLKLPFTQKAEEATGEAVQAGAERIVETDVVQGTIEKYNQLTPDQKAVVDGVLGTTEGLATMLGAGPAARAASSAIKSTNSAFRQGLDAVKSATDEVREIGSGLSGIQKSIDLGLKPEDIMQRVARVSKGKQAKFEERAGESVGSYLVSRNVFGTPDEIVDQLYKRMKESKGRVDSALSTVEGRFKADSVKTALDDLIERDVRVSTPGAKSPDGDRITELYKLYQTRGLTLSEVNEVKRLYERNVRVDYLSVGAPSDKLARANNVDSALRNLVEDKAAKAGVTTVRELNKETMLAKQLVDDIGAEYAGQAGNNAIGLTDAIFLAEAMGNPVAAAGFIAKKTLSSKAVMSGIAKRLSNNAGTKESLPDIPTADPNKLTGYLEFLQRQVNEASQ